MSDFTDTFLWFLRDVEASDQVLSDDLDRLCIQTESAYVRLGHDENMDMEQGTLWGAIRNTVELDQKGVGELLLPSLEIQVSKIDSFNNNMKSAVQASTNRFRELTYILIQLRHQI